VFKYSLEHDKSILLKEIERFEGRRREFGKGICNYENYLVNRGIIAKRNLNST